MGAPYALAALVAAMMAMTSNPAYAIPQQVQTAADGYVETCEAMGASVQPTDQYISALDVNGNGQTDYMIDTAQLGCSAHCGSAGCVVELWLAGPNGLEQAYRGNVQGWTVRELDGEQVIVFDVHGSWCGRTGVEPCQQIVTFKNGVSVETR